VRKIKMFLLPVMMLVLVFLCLPVSASSVGADKPVEYDGYIVKLKNDTTHRISLFGIDERKIGKGLYKVDSLIEAENIAGPDNIEYIEPNYYLTLYEFPDTDPNDEYYADYQWNLEMINASAAWRKGMFGAGAKVAVIDTGLVAGHEDIDYTHVTGGKNYTNDGGETDTQDQTGHGSFVSGIIASQINNATGFSGMTDEVLIIPVKCFAPEFNTTVSVIIDAIDEAIAQGCDVINMSFGMYSYSSSLEITINQAAAEGIILVASVGNNGTAELSYPAAYENVIGVGSVNSSETISSFSQKNTSVFVTAPGENLASLGYTGPEAYQLGWSGTSFSAPCVSAMAALAKSFDKDITTESFKTLLINSSKDLGTSYYDTTYGYGLVQVGNFIAAMENEYTISLEPNGGGFSPGTDIPAIFTVQSNNIILPVPLKDNFSFEGWYEDAEFSGEPMTTIPPGSAGNKVYFAKWRDTTGTNITTVSVSEYMGTRTGLYLFTVEIPAGATPSATPAAVSVIPEDLHAAVQEPVTDDEGYTWKVLVISSDGLRSREFIIEVVISDNHAPVVAEGQETQNTAENAAIPASSDGLTIAKSYVADVSGWFTDLDVDDLNYIITGTDALGEISTTGSSLTFTPAAGDAGKTVSIRLKASDGQFESGEVNVMADIGALPVSHSIIVPVSAGYDQYAASANHSDITVEITLYGNTLISIRNGDNPLTENVDYTVTNGMIAPEYLNGIGTAIKDVLIKSTYLDDLATGIHTLAFEFSAGNTAFLAVSVTDTTPLYTVTFMNDSAQYSIIENIRKGNTVTLPAQPTKTGYTFGGWYTGQNGTGAVFTSSTAVNASLTVYAKWTQSNSGNNGYSPFIPFIPFIPSIQPIPVKFTLTTEAGEGGSISGNETVEKSKNVTIIIEPQTGYDISGVFIDDKPADLTTLIKNEDGTYSLIIEAIDSNHTVRAEFRTKTPVLPKVSEPVFELFSDIPEKEWYTDAIQFVYDRGLFNGTGGSNFSPKQCMTRSMFVSVLGRLAGINEAQQSSSNFTDVKGGIWYATFVAWASESGIVGGYGNGEFGSNDNISREQMALFLYRYAKWRGYDVSGGSGGASGQNGGDLNDADQNGSSDNLAGFYDAGSVSDWAADAVNWAAGLGLIRGKPGNMIDPQGIATRAEVAVIIQRFIQAYEQG